MTSVDGVSANDLISKKAMLSGLRHVEGGSSTLPFVRMFYGSPSENLWEDDAGKSHSIPQGEGGEQGALWANMRRFKRHRGLRDGKSSSHSWTTFTWPLTQKEWDLSMP